MFYIYISFIQIALTVFNLQSGHEIAFTYVARGIIKNIYKQELWFLCITSRLIMVYTCMKFHHNISISLQVLERTRFGDGQTDPRTDKRTRGEKQYVARP